MPRLHFERDAAFIVLPEKVRYAEEDAMLLPAFASPVCAVAAWRVCLCYAATCFIIDMPTLLLRAPLR